MVVIVKMWGGKYAQHPPAERATREVPRDAGYYGAVPPNEVTDMGFLGGERGSQAVFVTEDTTRLEPARDFWATPNYAFHNDTAVSLKSAEQRYGQVKHARLPRANGDILRVQRQPEITMPGMQVPSVFMAAGLAPRQATSTKLFRPVKAGSEVPEAPSRPGLHVPTARFSTDRGREKRQESITVFANANLAPPLRPFFVERQPEEATLQL